MDSGGSALASVPGVPHAEALTSPMVRAIAGPVRALLLPVAPRALFRDRRCSSRSWFRRLPIARQLLAHAA